MSREIERQLATLQQGDHLCLIHESADEQMAAVVPFIRQGISRGERCVYIVDERTAEEVAATLAAGGVDVARERERGALLLLTRREAYLRSGRFDPESMMAFLRRAVAEALAAGFTGLRTTGEMTWALGPEVGGDRLIEYETLLNRFVPGSRALAICQYSRRRFPSEIIQDVLRTHPVALLGEEVCPNLYYEPPEMVIAREPSTTRVNWMIGQLRRARAAERAVEDRTALLVAEAERRRQSEEALRESEERYRTSIENMLDPFGIYSSVRDESGRIVDFRVEYVNAAACAGNAMTREEQVGRGLLELLPAHRESGLFDEYCRVIDTGEPLVRESLIYEDLYGHQRLVRAFDIRASRLGDGFAATWRDVTDRKLAEGELERRVVERTAQFDAANRELQAEIAERNLADESLRQTRDYLEKLFDHANAPIIVWDPSFRITRFNRAFEHLTGYAAREVVGRELRMLFPAATQEESLARIARTLGGEQWESVEIPILRKDGGVRMALWNSANVHAEDGRTIVATIAQGQDITERKRAEMDLQRERDFVSALLDTAGALVLVVDRQGRIVRFNRACSRTTGYSYDEVAGRPFWDFLLVPEEVEPVKSVHAQLTAGQFPNQFENYWVAKDGTRRWIAWSNTALLDEGGSVEYVIGAGVDVTEQRQAEESLRASEERYRLLVEGARDYALFMLDPGGRVISWSPGADRIHGYRAEEIIGQHFARFYTSEDVDQGKPEQELATAAAEGRIEEEGWRVRRDGSRIWANVIVTAVHDGDGKLRGFSKLTRDMTERRQVEEQLRKLSRAVEQSPATVVITDLNGSIEYVNPRFTRSTGYTREEAMGQNPRILKSGHLPPEEYERLWKTITAGGEWRGEFHNRRKDGELYWEAASISPIRGPAGTITHFLAVKEDITERKQAEAEIRKLNADLMHQAQELRAINAELEAFSYSVSHDLRAPLRSIDGFSAALLEDYSDLLDDQGKDYLRRVRAGSQRMGQLIDDMLTLSRVARSEMQRERVDLSALAESIALELQGKQPERRAEFIIAPGLVAEGDGRLLRLVLENLVGNAWKFTEKHPSARIEFGSTRREGETAYFVRDDGAGFDMAFVDKLFGAFQRLHGQQEFPGTGIGLATVQRILRRHGGRVWAEGQVERGATFYFTL